MRFPFLCKIDGAPMEPDEMRKIFATVQDSNAGLKKAHENEQAFFSEVDTLGGEPDQAMYEFFLHVVNTPGLAHGHLAKLAYEASQAWTFNILLQLSKSLAAMKVEWPE